MEPANWGRYPYVPMVPPPEKAVTITNDVNVNKETLKLVPDEENAGKFLVSFTFDATVAGRYKNSTFPHEIFYFRCL